MNCKNCGKPLSGNGYVCKFCGVMMDEEQIKKQKSLIIPNNKPLFVSEKYGGKMQIYEKRSQKENKLIGFIIIMAVLLLIIILALIVYFNK